MAKANPSSEAFVAKLTPRAARLNLNPHLSDVTLASILTGDTCAPISLADFEKHLAFVEHSVENLQFLVWFQDYRERYHKFFRDPTSPSGSDFVFGLPSPVKTEERAAESIAKLEKARTVESKDSDLPPSPTSPNDVASPTSVSPMLPLHTKHTIPSLTLAHPEINERDTNASNLRRDCLRAVATFLTPGSTKELSLDSVVRDTAIRNTSLDYHPDALLPVYEEIYAQVEQCSVPRFLAVASTNVNLPKQIYWYAVGVFNILFGITISLLLILLVPTPPNAHRAWRIFGVGFFGFGVGQIYSGWRGYCSQVWMRGATQLRVWEMQDMDAEAKAFVSAILDPHQDPPKSKVAPSLEEKAPQSESDAAVIAPFALESQMKAGRSSVSTEGIPSFGAEVPEKATHNFNRPPIFGPEAVVLDPRIKRIHRQIMIDILCWAASFALAFGAIVFSAPSRAHPRS